MSDLPCSPEPAAFGLGAERAPRAFLVVRYITRESDARISPRPTDAITSSRRRARRASAPRASRRSNHWRGGTASRPSAAERYVRAHRTAVARLMGARLPTTTDPTRRGAVWISRCNLDFVAVRHRHQRRDLPLILAPTARCADAGMHRIGETIMVACGSAIRRPSAKQNLIVKQFELGVSRNPPPLGQ